MILLVGATGLVGGMIARRLLGQGLAVRILVRPGSDYHSLVEAGAQPVAGDLKCPATLAPARSPSPARSRSPAISKTPRRWLPPAPAWKRSSLRPRPDRGVAQTPRGA